MPLSKESVHNIQVQLLFLILGDAIFSFLFYLQSDVFWANVFPPLSVPLTLLPNSFFLLSFLTRPPLRLPAPSDTHSCLRLYPSALLLAAVALIRVKEALTAPTPAVGLSSPTHTHTQREANIKKQQ